MSTSTKSKDQLPDVEHGPEAADQEPVEHAGLTDAQMAERSRQYVKLRMAATPGDAEEARERIRAIDGPDAEIGDHVLVLADGTQVRTEYAGATMHNGVPVVLTYTSIQ